MDDGRTPFRTALWMVLAISLLMGVGAAIDSGEPFALLWTLVFVVILGVPAIVVAAVVRWRNVHTDRA